MKIITIGRNDGRHNKAPESALYKAESPMVWLKADSALLKGGKPFFVPDFAGRFDVEAHLAVRISRLGKCIAARFAHRYYDAFTVGLDFTARDMLDGMRAEGLPWDVSKGFDGSAAIGEWVDKDLLPQAPRFGLDADGRTVQSGCACDLRWGVDELIAYVSRFFTLKTGDLLFAGALGEATTVAMEQHLSGWIEGRRVLEMNVK